MYIYISIRFVNDHYLNQNAHTPSSIRYKPEVQQGKSMFMGNLLGLKSKKAGTESHDTNKKASSLKIRVIPPIYVS